MPEDDVLTVAQVATELHCSKPHVYKPFAELSPVYRSCRPFRWVEKN